jgi:hypothetical protein
MALRINTNLDALLSAGGAMRTPTTTARAPSGPDTCKDDLPPCPVCEGLECLCRPRFFPGQLLTDDDLNRLQRYIVGKNKLHNRYLHGWGVACGLEVVCDPCKSTNVIVRTGYALSPCGDDIAVCKDQSVNVCELIQQCRDTRESECDPPYQAAPSECREGSAQWVLAICYDENPSRGVTALTRSTDSACCSSCGCGGSSSCGCQTGDAKKAKTTTSSRKSYKPQCEPTQICEGYRFIAYKLPRTIDDNMRDYAGGVRQYGMLAWMYANRAKFGPLLESVLCCVMRAMELRAQVRENREARASALDVYLEYVDALREFTRDFALRRCDFVHKVNELSDDAVRYSRSFEGRPLNEGDVKEVELRLLVLDKTWSDIIAECFCSALLPGCPEPAVSNCVPLGVVTVKGRDCSVVSICNWEQRKLLITWPTVTYWLSWLPWHQLRRWITLLCCSEHRSGNLLYYLLMMMVGTAASGMTRLTLLQGSVKTEDMVAPADAFDAAMKSENLFAHTLGGFEKLRSGADAAAPMWATLAARLVDGSAFAPLAGAAAVADVATKDLAANLGVNKLKEKLDELQKTVDAQKKIIDALKIVRGQ